MSGYSIDITLWGVHFQIQGVELANLRSLPTPLAIVIKGGRVTYFNGKIVGTISNNTIFMNPKIEETLVLQRWFHDNGFCSASPSLGGKFNASHSSPCTIIIFNELQTLQTSEKLVWYSLVATITNVDMGDFHFLACPLFVDGIECMKFFSHKVGNIWHCAKCDG